MPGAQISKERQQRRDFYVETREWMFGSVMKARVRFILNFHPLNA